MTRIYDRLESATLHFARSGAIKDRLERAWRQSLASIEADDLPHELRLQFLELASQMQRERPLRGEDAVRATIRKMSNEEAERHAAHIVRMFCRMTRQQELELHLPTLPNSSAHVVQLFAAEG
ncbi:MAG TPA: hypothetical protein VFS13_05440 [Steroidobacteraceae bacterium]|jgi:hypothetical protein|nr:hypothetical protein [Steroidobacteraceae bacterium]